MTPPVTIPDGVLTLLGGAAERQRAAEERCLKLLLDQGFRLVLLPVLGYKDDVTGSGYRFLDRSGQVVGLRTDFTPLAARVLRPTLEHADLPLGVCYAGEVLRPGPARLRQLPELFQLGFERYGAQGDGLRALALTMELLGITGVSPGRCHVTASLAGLAEKILVGVTAGAPTEELLELMRTRDVDALQDYLVLEGELLEALTEALLDGVDGTWPEALGVERQVDRLRPFLAAARAAGATASVDVAPRLAGSYYDGAVFSVLGRGTLATLAGGGEYQVELRQRSLPAVGGCVALGVALEEASC